ncbi:hypothetical protein N9Y42_10205 [Mariniblastus sp.]|nr:hypothetical protein [Mariniblastus sp.]
MSNEVASWPRYLDALGKELERRGLPFVRCSNAGWFCGNTATTIQSWQQKANLKPRRRRAGRQFND